MMCWSRDRNRWGRTVRWLSSSGGMAAAGYASSASAGDPRCGSRTIFGMPSEHVIVASTTDNEQAARALAAGAIDARLGACAQVVGPITSVYRWEGKVQTEQEWRWSGESRGRARTAVTRGR